MAPIPNAPSAAHLLRRAGNLQKRVSLEFKTQPLSSGMKATIAVGVIILVVFLVALGFFVWKYYSISKVPQLAHVGPKASYPPSLNEKGSVTSSSSSTSAVNPPPTSTPTPTPTPPIIIATPAAPTPPPAVALANGRRPSVPKLNLIIDTPPASATTASASTPEKGWTAAAKNVHTRCESAQSAASMEVPPTPSRTFV